MEHVPENKEWFAEWFDSPYYHLLYQNRDYTEADAFVRELISTLKPPAASKILDLACGKGRHALAMSQLGLDVTGVDLSPESIREASKETSEQLRFAVHDMREVLPGQRFHYVLNLFTSFGYFDDDQENRRVLRAIHEMLLPEGVLVIDFMNVNKVISRLVSDEIKTCGAITFNLKRNYDGKHITKEIRFEDQGQAYQYQERVQAISLEHFHEMLDQTGFRVENHWGSYQLDTFNPSTSDRLIILARKC